MLFRSKLYSATWDTWMYYENGNYYLYYLITEHSPGEGFGVATSPDGVHWTDHGAAIRASEEMVVYLGTGAVWKSPSFESDQTYYCNYSEWRESAEGTVQTILFARSRDLIHWEKCGDPFRPDPRYYRVSIAEQARWDCIYPLLNPGGGYYGYWTAAPRDGVGVGFGISRDGLKWEALPPPPIELGQLAGMPEVEAGAACEHNGTIYLMAGNCGSPAGIEFYTAAAPQGPFRPMKKSAVLFSNRTHMHAYFARFFQGPDGLLANFHCIERAVNEHDRPYTWLSPIKRVQFDADGILRLAWWEQNEALKGHARQSVGEDCIIEGGLRGNTSVGLVLKNGTKVIISFAPDGVVQYQAVGEGAAHVAEEYSRGIEIGAAARLRLLVSGSLTELYVNDIYIGSYTLTDALADAEGIEAPSIWGWAE